MKHGACTKSSHFVRINEHSQFQNEENNNNNKQFKQFAKFMMILKIDGNAFTTNWMEMYGCFSLNTLLGRNLRTTHTHRKKKLYEWTFITQHALQRAHWIPHLINAFYFWCMNNFVFVSGDVYFDLFLISYTLKPALSPP